jgi:hypothetical protein
MRTVLALDLSSTRTSLKGRGLCHSRYSAPFVRERDKIGEQESGIRDNSDLKRGQTNKPETTYRDGLAALRLLPVSLANDFFCKTHIII